MGKRVLAVVTDLFFVGKINSAAEQAGAEVRYARDSAKAKEIARDERPSLIIIDLHASSCAPVDLLGQLKADAELRQIPTLGFVSHLQTDLQEQARKAGCDRVVARSVFSRDLVEILAEP